MPMTIEEINQSYQDFQDELATRELHLKYPVTFSDDHQDDLFTLLKEINESTPLFIETNQENQEVGLKETTINTL